MAQASRALSAAVDQIAEYKRTGRLQKGMRETTVYDNLDVRKIRAKTKLTQQAFADRLYLSVKVVKNWEQGLRFPQGPARALLITVDHNHEVVFAALDAAHAKPMRMTTRTARKAKAAKKPTVRKAPAKRVLAKKPTVPKNTAAKKTVAKKARTTRRKSAARPPTPRGVAA